MANDKILYERNHVVIKDRPAPQKEASSAALLNEITGTIAILDNERRQCFRFLPLGLEDTMTEDWALINGTVSFKNNDADSVSVASNPLTKFRFVFNLNDLQCVRRHHMAHGIAHMIFTLKDGKTLPMFFFHLGGSKELLNLLLQCLPLEK